MAVGAWVRGRRDEQAGRGHRGVLGKGTTLCDNTMVDPCHHKLVKSHRMHGTESEPIVLCGLWMEMMCRCRLLGCD